MEEEAEREFMGVVDADASDNSNQDEREFLRHQIFLECCGSAHA